MINIKELSLEELEKTLISWGEPKFHARQIFSWLYKKPALSFDAMSDLSVGLRDRLEKEFSICDLELASLEKSKDLTEKFLFKLKDSSFIEAVLIPSDGRITACLSTQVGCRFCCHFCASGLLGFKRNLSPGEILDQVWFVKNNLKDGNLSNIVFMGTGEPLDNYDNVLKAIRIINSSGGFGIGARKITISTCGLVPGIKKLYSENLQVELSISLHSAIDKIRSSIMPVNKKYPIKELISACREYIEKTDRQITFEYVLIKGLNCDLQNARELAGVISTLKLAKLNLIVANPVKECSVEPPNKLEILLFKDYLVKHGINVTLRKPRGEDINAACGQLRMMHEKK